MKPFQYHEPKTLDEACSLLFELSHDAKILAGGTDLVVRMKQGAIAPKHVINIKKIKTLDFIEGNGVGFRIGTLARLSDIATRTDLRERLPILCSAARTIGSAQGRNIATLGGNLCNAAPSADMAPGLLVLDATVKIAGPAGERAMALEEFFLEPSRVNLKKGEMLKEVFIPFPPDGTKQLYIKHGPRRAMDIAVVGVAVALTFDGAKKPCQKARIALGAVAPTPVRAKKAEGLIVGKKIDEIPIDLVAETVRREVEPISDVRASKAYRTEMVFTLTTRAIKKLIGNK